MKDSKNLFKRMGFIGLGFCATCCLLPIGGIMLGIGSLTLISGLLEVIGLIAMISSVVFFSAYLARRRKPATCDTDCSCRDDKELNIVKP